MRARAKQREDEGHRAVVEHLRPDISVTLERVERRRAHLWTVAAVFILLSSVAVAIVLSGGDPADVFPESPTLRWALLGMGLAFVLYVVDQERRLRGLTRALFEAEVLAASLQSRVRDLSTLTRVGHLVNSVLTMEEVLEVLLDAVFELTGAERGSVLFVEEEQLRVAVSAGTDAPPRGQVVKREGGVVGWILTNREPLLINGDLNKDQFPGHHQSRRARGSSITAPMLAGDDLIGVLSVERPVGAAPFTEIQLRSVALFAAQAATAVLNARRYEEQRSTVEQLADALERRSEFVATLVHELKTPLTAIVGFTSVLTQRAEQLDDDKRTEMVAAVRKQAQRLRDMVDEVLRVASADAGADLRREPVDLRALAEGGAESARAIAVGRDGAPREVTIHVEDDLATVYGDPDALHRVLDNLCENAVKYSPAGTPVEVTVEQADGEVRMSVTDHGGGIAPEDLESIFERFRRGPGALGDIGGAGLGLYIVRSLVGAHGGRVWAESEPGERTTFTVALPIRHPAGPGQEPEVVSLAGDRRGTP